MARPKLFAASTFEEGLERAATERKLLLVDATAAWCGPCGVMDRTTWVDAAVERALAEAAICLQIDVDVEKDLAKRLLIRAMPTVIAFRERLELDRVVGLQKPSQILSWLDDLRSGVTSLQRVRDAAAVGTGDVRARMRLAGKLREVGNLEEATEHYLWLWRNMVQLEPAMIGVKHSFFLNELHELIAAHPPARAQLDALRADTAPTDGAADVARLHDWMSLNTLLGADEATLAWFDRSGPDVGRGNDKLAWLIESRVVPLLVKRARWADAGRAFLHPIASLTRHAQITRQPPPIGGSLPPEVVERMRELGARSLRSAASTLVTALRAAGRLTEADEVDTEARRLDPSAEMASALTPQAG